MDHLISDAYPCETDAKNRLLTEAIKRSPEPMVVTDLDGRIRIANPAARRLHHEIGHHFDDDPRSILFGPRVSHAFTSLMIQTVHAGESLADRVQVTRGANRSHAAAEAVYDASEDAKWLHVHACPLFDDHGRVDSILLAKRIVTAEVAEERVARLRAEGGKVWAKIARELSGAGSLK